MESVIVIHPDVERRNFFYEVLSRSNYKVTTLPSPAELRGALKAERPGCIVLSVDRDSGDLLKQVRDIDKSIKVLALIEEGDKQFFQEQFFLDKRMIFLSKNLDISQLTQSILSVLQEKEVEPPEKRVDFKGSVLVVDDDRDCCQLVTAYLNRRGYNADNALSGEEALLKIKAFKPKIVILDVLMPGMDGLLVLKRIKEIDEGIIVLVTTGLEDDKIAREVMRLGAAGYMTKPFNFTKLEAFILSHSLK